MTMKVTTGIAVALAALLASPAFAQSIPDTQRDAYRAYGQQTEEYAPPPFASGGRRHSPNPAWDVYGTDGHYLGSDPDPNVREMLERDREEGGSF